MAAGTASSRSLPDDQAALLDAADVPSECKASSAGPVRGGPESRGQVPRAGWREAAPPLILHETKGRWGPFA